MDYSHVTLKKFTWHKRQHIPDGFYETLEYYESQGFKPVDKANVFYMPYMHSCISFTVAQTFSYLDIPEPFPCCSKTRGKSENRVNRKLDVWFNDYKKPLDELKAFIEKDYYANFLPKYGERCGYIPDKSGT